MTINTLFRADADGNDLALAFPYGFKIFAATHLVVKVRNTADDEITTLTYPTQYSVSNVGNGNGGNVTLVAVGGAWQNVDGSLKTGYSISSRRVVPLLQATDIRNQGGFFADVHEDEFDYLTMIDQQQQDDIDRSIKMDSAFASDTLDLTLPAPVAGMGIGFNSTADGLALISSVGNAATTAFTLSLLDDANAAAARATLGVTFPDIFDAAGDLTYASAADVAARLAIGTARQVLRVNAGATAPEWGSAITLTAEQATTSGSSINFPGIPAGVKRITVMFSGVSTTGTFSMLIRIGDAGGIETSGYNSSASNGFEVAIPASAASTISGNVTLSLQNAATFTWVSSGAFWVSGGGSNQASGGSKSLSAELTQVTVTISGADTFDLGALSLSYE